REACPPAVVPPAGVARRAVAFDPPVELPREEWLLATNPTRLSRAGDTYARIAWPAARAIIDGRAAVADPAHTVEFHAPSAPSHVRWHLDGQVLGVGPRARWHPRAGRYLLELRTPDGRILDAVDFAARGPL
ncbi:MAG: hypothetical protein KDH20_17960, partial [Rhodocyclaceae bacterium]|nr:hypothetical protein [Rhodocyclaceae bacterium]